MIMEKLSLFLIPKKIEGSFIDDLLLNLQMIQYSDSVVTNDGVVNQKEIIRKKD